MPRRSLALLIVLAATPCGCKTLSKAAVAVSSDDHNCRVYGSGSHIENELLRLDADNARDRLVEIGALPDPHRAKAIAEGEFEIGMNRCEAIATAASRQGMWGPGFSSDTPTDDGGYRMTFKNSSGAVLHFGPDGLLRDWVAGSKDED